MRLLTFSTGEYYHVYNRGVDKRKIFLGNNHYRRFLKSVQLLLATGSATPRLRSNQSLALNSKITIICYCLMPNHYHVLIKQIKDGGISEFMHKIDTSYTKYFNLNQKRTGRLFEYTFKAKHIPTDEILLHVHRYIHLNPLIINLVSNVNDWEWSSYVDYVGKRQGTICSKEEILGFFSQRENNRSYKEWILDQKDYAMLLKESDETKGGEDGIFL